MSDGWETFLATGTVADYLKAKSEEQSQMGASLQENPDKHPVADGQALADGRRDGWNGRSGAEMGCRIM